VLKWPVNDNMKLQYKGLFYCGDIPFVVVLRFYGAQRFSCRSRPL